MAETSGLDDLFSSLTEEIQEDPEETSVVGTPEFDEKAQASNLRHMDAPIPGQSLTAPPGEAPYERPPEYTQIEPAMDFLVNKIMMAPTQTKMLRMMDAGVPISALMEIILMHGAQEGKWSIDLALALSEPLAVVLYSLGNNAGIKPKLTFKPKQQETSTKNIRKIFKEEAESNRIKPQEAPEIEIKKPGLLARG